MASIAVTGTLRHVTAKKAEKLSRQHAEFEAKKSALLQAVAEAPTLPQQVTQLLEGVQSLLVSRSEVGARYRNLDMFLRQSIHDASVQEPKLLQWKRSLERDLDQQSNKYQFSSLFTRLVTEWIKKPSTMETPQGHVGSDSDSDTSDSSYEALGREEMHKQRREWESYAFQERKIDPKAVKAYLEALFGSTSKSKKSKKTPIETLRESVAAINSSDKPIRIDQNSVRSAINGILKNDLFAGEKREALLDLKTRKQVLKEMADVLKADLDALQSWEWEPAPVPLTVRKQINGKYRFFYNEEIHQAIFLQIIGTEWAVHLKTIFKTFFNSGAWIQAPFRPLSRTDAQRREFFLGKNSGEERTSIRNVRRQTYFKDYFMTQLPNSTREGTRDYNNGNDDEDTDDDMDFKSPREIKQSILRLITTESLIHTHIHGHFVVFQSDFKWFGPALPHSTIFAVLEYFGVSQKWLNFFKVFLTAPLIFESDGSNPEIHQRTCGIPMSHILSDALGETVLFVLDFAVNQKSKSNLHRFHDDLWFWGHESECVSAWNAITEFSKIMGMDLSEEKTGTVKIVKDKSVSKAIPKSLPAGVVRWGFLRLDAVTGKWVVDQENMAPHVVELKRQLSACRSVLAYVQVYNAFVTRFFINNLGAPANCLGQEHVDMILDTLREIEGSVFSDAGNGSESITKQLKSMIEDRFGVKSIPDGYFFFPVELCGLDVRNPFITLAGISDAALEDPSYELVKAVEEEEENYERQRERFENSTVDRSEFRKGLAEDTLKEFMPFEEYVRYPEERSIPFHNAYVNLLEPTVPEGVEDTRRYHLREAISQDRRYNAWVRELYGDEILECFGELHMGEKDLLPLGLLKLLRSERLRLDG